MNAEGIKALIESLKETEETEVLQKFEERLRQMSDEERSSLVVPKALILLQKVRSENPKAMARQRAVLFGANVPFNS